MANDKLTWVEFKHAVAVAADVTDAEATSFLNALTQLIEEALKNGDTIKMKGVGTFATKAMAERESVNVVTKERFVIPAYNKVVFTPEAQMQEMVEKRISTPATAAVVSEITNDPMQKLSQQADEITDILADLGQAPATKQPETPDTPVSPEAPETPESPETPEEPEEPETPETPETPEEPETPETPDTPSERSSSHTWIWVAVIIVVLAVAGGLYYYTPARQWIINKVTAIFYPEQNAVEPEPVIVEEVEPATVVEPEVEAQPQEWVDTPRVYTEFITTETIPYGSRLAWLSYKYYGTKELWVFIYEANRDHIAVPNKVRVRQRIRIPKLDEQLMDLSNPQTRQLVDKLTEEYKQLNL